MAPLLIRSLHCRHSISSSRFLLFSACVRVLRSLPTGARGAASDSLQVNLLQVYERLASVSVRDLDRQVRLEGFFNINPLQEDSGFEYRGSALRKARVTRSTLGCWTSLGVVFK